MTDAALPVTERAVERVVTDYLESLGASVQKQGRQWMVSMPADAPTDLDIDGETLDLAANPDEVSGDATPLAPGSDLFERLVDEATECAPVGAVTLTGDDIDLDAHNWIAPDVKITSQRFTPYYDRHALCVLFHVGVETVSEYQRETLRAVAVDLADYQARPAIARTCLDLTADGTPGLDAGGRSLSRDEFTDALAACRSTVEDSIDSTIRETRERATRAATVEIEEYRQYLRQRRDELAAEEQRLSDRIDDLSEAIDSASGRDDRVEGLRERKRLRNELTELRGELEEIRSDLDRGVPEKRDAVRDRHALTVRIQPVTATVVTYERGDLDIAVRSGESSATLTCDYAVGAGVLERPICETCERILDAENRAVPMASAVVGTQCCADQPPRQ